MFLCVLCWQNRSKSTKFYEHILCKFWGVKKISIYQNLRSLGHFQYSKLNCCNVFPICMLLNVHFTLFIFDAFTFTSFYIHIWAWGNRHLFNISPSWYMVVSKRWKIFKFMIEEIMLHACCSSCCVELANKINQRAALHRSSTLLPHCYRGKISQLSHFDLKCNFAE